MRKYMGLTIGLCTDCKSALSGGNLGWEYYKSMAYSGMFQVDPSGSIVAEVDTFKEIVPNANDRQVIANIILNEQNGNNQSKGTKCD